jgi:hypothetical protein
VIIAPEPAFWLEKMAADHGPLFAPWALASAGPGWLPAGVRRFCDRRVMEGAIGLPGWTLAEGALRAWTGARADRLLWARFALRRAVDFLAARWVRRHRPKTVVAPSCAAEASFAAAHEVGARCILVEDLPDVRGLHRDLDRAAEAHPECAFLRRYRAQSEVAARQEVERLFADEIYVRGRFAWSQRVASGVEPSRLRELFPPRVAPLVPAGNVDSAARLRLAGLAAARNGSVEVLRMLETMPRARVLVRAGEGAEPRALFTHPQVMEYDGGPVDLVIAPAWCETYPTEVVAASASGIPVVATARAALFSSVFEIAPGDDSALSQQVAAALAARSTPSRRNW